MIKASHWIYLGPLFVIIGAGLWGTETPFRVNLNTRFDSEVLVFHEHLFCILFTLPFVFGTFKQARKAPLKSWIYLILSGVIGSALGTTFFTLALSSMNASVANILLNFQPIVSIIFAKLLLREKLGRGFFIWAAIALACGAVIAVNDFKISEFQWTVGLVYITITALAWGFATVAGRGAMMKLPLRTATAGRFVIGALALLVSLSFKHKFNGTDLKWEQLTDVFVIKNYLRLSIMAGVIPLYFYFKGLSKTSASVGGFCELTQTFTALLITWGFMGEPLTTQQVIAGLVLLVCVYMINLNFAKANRGQFA
jgi:drug/metabolite transporter, DME family